MLKSTVIEEKKFKHSPWAGTDNPLGPNVLCQQEDVITMVICCKFEKNLFNLWFIDIFTWFNKCIYVYSCRSGADNPRKKFWCQQKPLVTSVICYKFKKKSLWSRILNNFFHDFIHVYSPGEGADDPLGTKFRCQQEHLVTSVICCKFQNNLFEVWFHTIFFKILYMYIAPGRGRQPPGYKVLISTVLTCHFIHL